jgi:hypothetical protein
VRWNADLRVAPAWSQRANYTWRLIYCTATPAMINHQLRGDSDSYGAYLSRKPPATRLCIELARTTVASVQRAFHATAGPMRLVPLPTTRHLLSITCDNSGQWVSCTDLEFALGHR